MVAIKSETSQTKTRQQLLEAAGQVFAEYGYRAATVREICLRAGANIASIHYHFGDKERLYIEVLRYAHKREAELKPALFHADENVPPEQRLKQYVHSILLQLLDPSSVNWDRKLISREMVEPTIGLDVMMTDRIRPMSKHVRAIVRDIIGPNATEEDIREGEFNVVSNCVFYHHCRAVISRLYPKLNLGKTEIERLAERTTEFLLAGLRARANKK